MSVADAWRIVVRPVPYQEAATTTAPTSLEFSGWSVVTNNGTSYAPRITLVEDTRFDGSSFTTSSTEDERLVSKEYRINNFDFNLRFKFRVVGAMSDRWVPMAIVKDSAKFYDANRPVIVELPHSIQMQCFSSSRSVQLFAIDNDTVSSSTTIAIGAADVDRWIEIDKTGNTLTLSVFTTSSFTTHETLSPVTLDISSLTIHNLKHLMFGNYPSGVASLAASSGQISEIDLKIKDFIDVTNNDTDRIINIDMESAENENKVLTFEYDDAVGGFDDVAIGDEVLFWTDNEAKGLITSLDCQYTDVDGKLIDYSGNENVVTLNNGARVTTVSDTVTQAGKVELSTFFDGTNDWATSIKNLAQMRVKKTDRLTVMAWINVDVHDITNGETFVIGTSGGGFRLSSPSGSGRNVRYSVDVAGTFESFIGAASYAEDTWFHAAVVYDGPNIIGYFNGLEDVKGTPVSPNGDIVVSVGLDFSDASLQAFDGYIDEVMLFNRALTAKEIKDCFDRQRCSKLYFRGTIENIQRNQDGRLTIEAIESNGELVNQEVYDLIFEGHCLPSTKGGTNDKPAIAFDTGEIVQKTIAGATRRIIKLKDVDGSFLTGTSHSIADISFGYNDQSIVATDAVTVETLDLTPLVTLSFAFIAKGTRIKRLAVISEHNLGATHVVTSAIHPNTSDANTDDQPDTAITLASVTKSNESVADGFHIWDFSGASWTNDMSIGSKYWVRFSVNFENAFPSQPYFLISHNGQDFLPDRESVKFSGSTKTIFRENSGPISITFTDLSLSLKKIDESDYNVNFDSTEGWHVDVTELISKSLWDPTQGQPDAFVMFYIYSKGNLKKKHVIERLLRKTRHTKGAYSGRVTTDNMGLYVPQGGSIIEHINTIITPGSKAVQRVANYVHIENAFQRSSMQNGTMEKNEGWIFATNAPTKFRDLGYSTVDKNTGSRSYQLRMLNVAQAVGDRVEIYEDVENWGGAFNVFYKTDVTNANAAFEINKEPFGGGTRTNLFSSAISTSGWNRARITEITDVRFRLILTLRVTTAHTPSETNFFIDDAIQTQNEGLMFYGFKDGWAVEIGPTMDQFNLADISSANRTGEITRLVNLGISISKDQTSGRLNVAAAKDVKSYDKFGPRMAIREGGRLRRQDRYNRAKALLKGEFQETIALKLVGSYPFLLGKAFYLLYPDIGLDEWTLYNAKDVRLGLDITTIKADEFQAISSSSIQRIQESSNEEATTLTSPLSESFIYYIITDCQFRASPGTIKQAKITYTGATDLTSNFYNTPDTGVHIFEWNRKKLLSISPTADVYTSIIDIYNTSNVKVGSLRLPHGYKFVKLKNMTIMLVAFDRKTLLGQ